MTAQRDLRLSKSIDNWFTHHPPKDAQDIEAYTAIRNAGAAFADAINYYVPNDSSAIADKVAAIRKVREAVMTANAGIACSDAQ